MVRVIENFAVTHKCDKCVRNDMTMCNLDVNPLDRNSWRTSVRRCQVLPTSESGTTAAP